MPTWILRYDKRGNCTSPLTRDALVEKLNTGAYTDVISFSHGWNNEFGAATELYSEFLKRFEAAVVAHQPTRAFKPIFFGIVWPSTWLVVDDGPQIAGAGILNESQERSITSIVVDAMANELAAASAAEVERFYELVEKESLVEDEARELAQLAAPAFGQFTDDENRDGDCGLSADDVLFMVRQLERAEASVAAGASLDLDNFGGVGDAGGSIQAAGFLESLDPRNVVRLFSVYQMKDRAGTVGARGMGPLLRDVLNATDAPVHAVGHSYGCKVQLSAICEPTPLVRPADSLLLLEPAVSHLCFAEKVPGTNRSGGYRSALDSARARPPILSTYSAKDFPLHATFHLALRRPSDLGEAQIAGAATTAGNPPNRYAALGGYGPRDCGEQLVDPMPRSGGAYPTLTGDAVRPVIGLDGSDGVIGGHGDVRSDATAWALYQLVFRGA